MKFPIRVHPTGRPKNETNGTTSILFEYESTFGQVDVSNELRTLEARMDAANLVRKIEEESAEKAKEKARRVISMAIQRIASEHVIESTVSVVDLPSDEMKGRIIGREGRNIRAFEQATGVDLIVDDTPEAVILSCFEPVRREIARIALESLIQDGRIHPGRIEELVAKVQADMEEKLLADGEAAALEVGIPDLHPELHLVTATCACGNSARWTGPISSSVGRWFASTARPTR